LRRPGTVACKLCEHRARHAFTLAQPFCLSPPTSLPPSLDVFRCGGCGLLFVGTELTDRQLQDLYAGAPHESCYAETGEAAAQKARAALRDLDPILRASDRVLDVGCGDGQFLEELHRAYAVRGSGHELPGPAAEACRRKGLEVFTSPLADIPERFSVIVLLDVAEHVLDINRLFGVCHLLLTDQGYVYVHTPRQCFWDVLFEKAWRVGGLRALANVWLGPRLSAMHLQLWSDKALRVALERAGFELVYLRRELELSRPMESYVRYLPGASSMPPWARTLASSILWAVFVATGALRNKAVCLARKRAHTEPGAGID
jgi:SAM-dependent methyltransferase